MKHILSEGEPGQGGGAGGETIEQLQAKLAEMQTAMSEQNDEIGRLRKHSQKLLDEKKVLKTNLDKFEGIDLESMTKMMEQFENNEEAQLLANGKFDDVMNRRTEKMRLNFENKIEELTNQNTELQNERSGLQNKYNDAVVNNYLRAAAEQANVLPSAIDDVLARAKGTFSVLDNGDLEARDSDGNLRTVGNKQLTPELFVDSLKETAPHYWPASQSGGANGGAGGGGKQVNPFIKGSKDYNITEQARLRKSDPQLAQQFAEEAAAAAS